MRDPFFIIGAPRSGTTFLVELLNKHPKVLITDETRVFTHLSRILNEQPADQRAVMRHKAAWLEQLRADLPDVARRYYAKLGAPDDGRWGDKNPHYADRRTDPGCLETLDRLFPDSQFIHIVRDGRAVVSSLFALGWAKSPQYGADVWIRHVEQSRGFGSTIGPRRWLEVTYERLVSDPEQVSKELFDFLGLDVSSEVAAFVAAEQQERRPVSGATSDLAQAGSREWERKMAPDLLAAMNHAFADLLVAYGYEEASWRDALRAGPPAPMPVVHAPRRDVELATESVLAGEPGDAREALRALYDEYRALTKEQKDTERQRATLKEALDAERRGFNRLRNRQRRLVRRIKDLDPQGETLEARAARMVRAVRTWGIDIRTRWRKLRSGR
jgi:hypothetical protein